MGVPSGGQPGGASALSSVFTLLNSAIGAGVLSLPFAFRAAGWVGGILLTFAVAAVESFTMYLLARYAEFTGSKTYSDLVRKMLGRKASLSMSVALLLYCYGSATAYLIILGDCAVPILEQAFGQTWFTSRSLVILVLASAFMLPLCFPKTLDAISGFSSITFYALCGAVVCIIYKSVEAVHAPDYDPTEFRSFRPVRDMLDALPILAFGFQCHTNLVAVFAELEEEPDLFGSTASLAALVGGTSSANASSADLSRADADPQPGPALAAAGGRTPQQERVVLLRRPPRRFVAPAGRTQKLLGMVQVLCGSIGLTAIFYVLVGYFGYANFPADAHSNILLNYRIDDKLMQVARALVGIIQIIHYPVNHSPARNATGDLLSRLTGRPLTSAAFNAAEVLSFFCCTLALSLLVSDLGSVFKVTGGACGAYFIFIIPSAFCLQYAYNKHLHLRDGLQQPLAEDGAADEQAQQPQQAQQQQAQQDYHYLTSKIWWAGIVLMLLGLGLLALTGYTLLAPPV